MLIGKIHDFVNFLKNQGQSTYITASDIDDACHRASLDLFNEYLPLFEVDNTVTGALQPFKKRDKIELDDDLYPLPEGFVKATGMEVNGYVADELTDSEWFYRKNNPLTGPEEKYPIFRVHSDGLEVLPQHKDVVLYYLKTPNPPKYVSKPLGRKLVIDTDNSIDIEWPEFVHSRIISKTLGYLGFEMRDELLIQMEKIKP